MMLSEWQTHIDGIIICFLLKANSLSHFSFYNQAVEHTGQERRLWSQAACLGSHSDSATC